MTESGAKELLESIKNDNNFCGSIPEALELAINALEKQIPKKPISISSVENSIYVKCPTCKLRTVLYDGCSMDYCKNCGQKLNW